MCIVPEDELQQDRAMHIESVCVSSVCVSDCVCVCGCREPRGGAGRSGERQRGGETETETEREVEREMWINNGRHVRIAGPYCVCACVYVRVCMCMCMCVCVSASFQNMKLQPSTPMAPSGIHVGECASKCVYVRCVRVCVCVSGVCVSVCGSVHASDSLPVNLCLRVGGYGRVVVHTFVYMCPT